MLHAATLRIDFDPNHLKEVDEAKFKYIQARRERRIVTDLDGKELEKFPNMGGVFLISEKSMPDNFLSWRIFDETGDRRSFWDINDPKQIKEAADLFQDYIGRGWKAYALNYKGDKGIRIYKFDANEGEIYYDDKGTKERLKNFASKFREVKLLPRTYPG